MNKYKHTFYSKNQKEKEKKQKIKEFQKKIK